MTPSNLRIALAVAAALALVGPALAQTDPHHPSNEVRQGPPAAGAPTSPGTPMPGGGMPMHGMMNMMGQGNATMPDMGMHGMGMRGMAMIDRVEGRIAFLRTELKITDAQAKVWSDFAQSLKDSAKRLADVRAAVAKSADASAPTLVRRLESQERWLAGRLEGARAIKTAFAPLYAALSAEQKNGRRAAGDAYGPDAGRNDNANGR